MEASATIFVDAKWQHEPISSEASALVFQSITKRSLGGTSPCNSSEVFCHRTCLEAFVFPKVEEVFCLQHDFRSSKALHSHVTPITSTLATYAQVSFIRYLKKLPFDLTAILGQTKTSSARSAFLSIMLWLRSICASRDMQDHWWQTAIIWAPLLSVHGVIGAPTAIMLEREWLVFARRDTGVNVRQSFTYPAEEHEGRLLLDEIKDWISGPDTHAGFKIWVAD